MSENPGNYPGLFDGGNDFQFAATVGTVFDVGIEHSVTKAFLGFRPSGRRSPFKPAPSGLVSSRAQLMRAELK